jgi:putative ATP-dependent endonuclease of OLD family
VAKIRVDSVAVKNYRSFGNQTQQFIFPKECYKKPVAIVGYNNSGKTNLMNAIKYGLYESVREDTFELKDFHNCNWENSPKIKLNFTADIVDDKIQNDVPYFNQVEVLVEVSK